MYVPPPTSTLPHCPVLAQHLGDPFCIHITLSLLTSPSVSPNSPSLIHALLLFSAVVINDILDFTKMEQNKLVIEQIDFNLRALVHAALW